MFVRCECSVLYTYRPARRTDTSSSGIPLSVHVLEYDQVQTITFYFYNEYTEDVRLKK
jgi:hypothetical protein